MKLLFLAAILLVPVLSINAQDIKYISFKQEKIAYAPKEFYISDVADDRTDKKADYIINKGVGKSEKVMFTNGFGVSLKAFIGKNVSQNLTSQPIVLHITKLDVDIKKEGAFWFVNASATFSFYAAGKEALEFTSTGKGKINKDPGSYIEKFIRETVANDLKGFDKWWLLNKGKITTNPTVKVNVTISKTTDKPNCIAYSVQRPLQIMDFTGTPEGPEPELAVTLSGISVYYTGETKNGQFAINITITPYFDKSRSWFKEKGKNSYVLAHEQTHFDITAIKACEFVNEIRNTAFTEENYVKLIEQLRLQNLQQLNEDETKYDEETNHGNIQDKQEMWQNKTKEKVKAAGCY